MTMQTLYWRRDYFKRFYYKTNAWMQPTLTSATSYGNVSAFTGGVDGTHYPYKLFDKGGTGVNTKYLSTSQASSVLWSLPDALTITQVVATQTNESSYLNRFPSIIRVLGSNDGLSFVEIGSLTGYSRPSNNGTVTVTCSHQKPYSYILFDFPVTFGGNAGLQELTLTASAVTAGTESDYDYYLDEPGTEADHTYYTEKRVNADEEYTYTTETEILDTRKGPNLRFGIRHFGKFAFAAPTNIVDEGGGDLPDDKINYLPGIHAVIAYNKDGTKTAIFGAGSERDSIESMNFELVETGCGKVEITFRKLPTNAELNYRQRIDIHLFNDSRPWYSGYIITRPIPGTSDTNAYKFTGHGYYNLLDKVLIFKTYENVEVSNIVVDIARQVENKVGLTFNGNKIINTSYVISKIEFDGVTAKEALKQLTDFAIDYVYGVDEYRQLYFMPRNNEINEQARFWVGMHIGPYSPSWDVDKIVNRAYIKGGNVDDEGEQWLGMVEDVGSQAEYGIQEAVWSLPSAYSTDDGKRWGENQIQKYKEPVKSAKVQAVKLEYPKPDGSFFVRKLSTQGQAAITDLEGNRHDYPITKLKYTISGKDGIKLDMELGEQPFAVDKYFANLDRDAKMAELLQQAATKQLKTGG